MYGRSDGRPWLVGEGDRRAWIVDPRLEKFQTPLILGVLSAFLNRPPLCAEPLVSTLPSFFPSSRLPRFVGLSRGYPCPFRTAAFPVGLSRVQSTVKKTAVERDMHG